MVFKEGENKISPSFFYLYILIMQIKELSYKEVSKYEFLFNEMVY